MLKFKFRLQKLLEFRQTQVDIAMRDFAAAQAKERDEENRLLNMQGELQSSIQMKHQLQMAGGSVGDQIQSIQDYGTGQRVRIERQQRVLKSLQDVTEQKRLVLVEANQQVKTLEKLKEKKQTEHLREVQRREVKELDDMIVMRHGRRETV